MKDLNKRNTKKNKKIRREDKTYKETEKIYLNESNIVNEPKLKNNSKNIIDNDISKQSSDNKKIEEIKINKRYSETRKEKLNSYDYRNTPDLNKEKYNYNNVSYEDNYNSSKYSYNDTKQNNYLDYNNYNNEEHSYSNDSKTYDDDNGDEYFYYDDSYYDGEKTKKERKQNLNHHNYYYEDSSDNDKRTFDYKYYENASDIDSKTFTKQGTEDYEKSYDERVSPVFRKDPAAEKLAGYSVVDQIVNKRYSDIDRTKNKTHNYYYEDSTDNDKRTFDYKYYENASDTDNKTFTESERKNSESKESDKKYDPLNHKRTYDERISPVFKKNLTLESIAGYSVVDQIVNKRYSDIDRTKNKAHNYYYEDSSDNAKRTFDYKYYENASDTDNKTFTEPERKNSESKESDKKYEPLGHKKSYNERVSPVFKKNPTLESLAGYSVVDQIINKRNADIKSKKNNFNSDTLGYGRANYAQKSSFPNNKKLELSNDDNKYLSTYLAGRRSGKNLRHLTSRKAKGLAKIALRESVLELQSEDTLKRMFEAGYDINTKGRLAYLLTTNVVNTGTAVLTLPLLPLKKKVAYKDNDNLIKTNVKYKILKPRSKKSLKKSIKDNELGNVYADSKRWKEFISDTNVGLLSINIKKLRSKDIILDKKGIKKLLDNKNSEEFLKKRNARRLYKKDQKLLNKKVKKSRQIKHLSKVVALDSVRKMSNNISVDSGNLALSGFDTGVDIYRNAYKTTKSTVNFGVKTGKKAIKLGAKGTKGAAKQFKTVKKAVKGKTYRDKLLFKNIYSYKKIYKDNGLKSTIEAIAKDLILNIKEAFKHLAMAIVQFIKSAAVFTLGFVTSFMLPVFLVVSVITISIFGVSRIYPMTKVNIYDGIDDIEGEDFKEYFEFLRGMNNFGRVNEYDGNPDNSKALISIAARYFDNDFSDEEAVKEYLTYLHDISHIVKKEEVNGMTKIIVKTYEDPSEILKMIKDGTATEEDDETTPVGGNESGNSEGYEYSSDQVKEAFDKIVQEKNLNASQIEQWKYIIDHESGWNPLATNPSSGAYGLGQAYPANKMAPYGSDYLTNPYTQLKWMYDYMNEAYGGVTNAYNFWIAHNWY